MSTTKLLVLLIMELRAWLVVLKDVWILSLWLWWNFNHLTPLAVLGNGVQSWMASKSKVMFLEVHIYLHLNIYVTSYNIYMGIIFSLCLMWWVWMKINSLGPVHFNIIMTNVWLWVIVIPPPKLHLSLACCKL